MGTRDYRGAFLASAALTVLCMANEAAAQGVPQSEESSSSDEIIVTARLQSESVQDVPISIDVVGEDTIENAQIATVDDLRKFSSSLVIRTKADNTPDVTMRGVGSFGLTPGVGFYTNDVQVFEGQTARFDDLERVEILKGPQGTLYGGSSIGGAIKYITKRPTDYLSAEASIDVGNYDSLNMSGAVSGPLVPDMLNARISYFHSQTDGFIYNATLDTDRAAASNEDGLRITLEHDRPGTRVSLHFAANWLDSNNSNPYPTPASPDDVTYTIFHGTQGHFNRSIYSGSLNIDHDLTDELTLTSITSAFHSKSDTLTDVDKVPPPFLNGFANTKREVYSQELRLASTDANAFQWLVGAFVQINNPQRFLESVSFGGNPGNPAHIADPARYSSVFSDSRNRNQEYAAFVNTTYETGPWEFELGARVGHSKAELRDPRANLRSETSTTAFLPRISVSYDVNEDTMLFATVSRGATPGGLFEAFTGPGIPELITYDPETTWNYEVGFKAVFPGNIRLNASTFYVQYKDRLYQTTALQATQTVTVIRNVGDSENFGFEFDVAAPLFDGLDFTASFGLLRAEWGDAQFFDPNTGVVINLDGFDVPYAPTYQGRVGLDWSRDVGGGFELGARADVSFIGEQVYYPVGRFRGEPYGLVNLGASIEKDNWRLFAHASNLLDHRYYSHFFSAAELGAPRNVAQIAPPRLWKVGLSYEF